MARAMERHVAAPVHAQHSSAALGQHDGRGEHVLVRAAAADGERRGVLEEQQVAVSRLLAGEAFDESRLNLERTVVGHRAQMMD